MSDNVISIEAKLRKQAKHRHLRKRYERDAERWPDVEGCLLADEIVMNAETLSFTSANELFLGTDWMNVVHAIMHGLLEIGMSVQEMLHERDQAALYWLGYNGQLDYLGATIIKKGPCVTVVHDGNEIYRNEEFAKHNYTITPVKGFIDGYFLGKRHADTGILPVVLAENDKHSAAISEYVTGYYTETLVTVSEVTGNGNPVDSGDIGDFHIANWKKILKAICEEDFDFLKYQSNQLIALCYTVAVWSTLCDSEIKDIDVAWGILMYNFFGWKYDREEKTITHNGAVLKYECSIFYYSKELHEHLELVRAEVKQRGKILP